MVVLFTREQALPVPSFEHHQSGRRLLVEEANIQQKASSSIDKVPMSSLLEKVDEIKLVPKMSHAPIPASESGNDACNGLASAEKVKDNDKKIREASKTVIEDICSATNTHSL
ncbi:hypothetical protein V6N11_025911 [Hibiscus sabdariffa]|uniref:Uncharacterized protein n=1 Tax=Hibiscus sabdariffa TaxID=183260 RepID=A0ABR2SUW1_9ROSI